MEPRRLLAHLKALNHARGWEQTRTEKWVLERALLFGRRGCSAERVRLSGRRRGRSAELALGSTGRVCPDLQGVS